jgi:hypothetical protein
VLAVPSPAPHADADLLGAQPERMQLAERDLTVLVGGQRRHPRVGG